jgi:hypothetical protein
MRPKEAGRAQAFQDRLTAYHAETGLLVGIEPDGYLACLVEQLVESRRRIEYVEHLRDSAHSPRRLDPGDAMFDPLRAAVLHARKGDMEEAHWLIFLATHFGKHANDGWRLAANVYGRLSEGRRWDWKTISVDPAAFRIWLAARQAQLMGRRFSNHRKFESLKVTSAKGTAIVFETYIAWALAHGGHVPMVRELHKQVGQNPVTVFDALYHSMDAVHRFGRLARFDFLTMLGKLGLSPIEPGSAYLWHNASGPLRGARLLYTGNVKGALSARDLDAKLEALDQSLRAGMQAMEDALCNWQKSPAKFISFRG